MNYDFHHQPVKFVELPSGSVPVASWQPVGIRYQGGLKKALEVVLAEFLSGRNYQVRNSSLRHWPSPPSERWSFVQIQEVKLMILAFAQPSIGDYFLKGVRQTYLMAPLVAALE